MPSPQVKINTAARFMTVTDAARILGLAPPTVRRRLKAAGLEIRKLGRNRTLIPASHIDALVASFPATTFPKP